MAQTRRQFLRRALGAGAALAVPFDLEALASSPAEQPSKSYTLNDYINAIIEIESNGNPNAERYEPYAHDTSYGLGQILTRTAKDLERRHPELPRLGKTKEQIKDSLFNPDTNRAYTTALFKEEFSFYQDPYLAVAAYNSGHLKPRNARCQQQLNDLYKTRLITDGVIGKSNRDVVRRFQRSHGLEADSKIGRKTYAKLQEVWQARFSGKKNPKGIIPINKYTPNHVKKFRNALESN